MDYRFMFGIKRVVHSHDHVIQINEILARCTRRKYQESNQPPQQNHLFSHFSQFFNQILLTKYSLQNLLKQIHPHSPRSKYPLRHPINEKLLRFVQIYIITNNLTTIKQNNNCFQKKKAKISFFLSKSVIYIRSELTSHQLDKTPESLFWSIPARKFHISQKRTGCPPFSYPDRSTALQSSCSIKAKVSPCHNPLQQSRRVYRFHFVR